MTLQHCRSPGFWMMRWGTCWHSVVVWLAHFRFSGRSKPMVCNPVAFTKRRESRKWWKRQRQLRQQQTSGLSAGSAEIFGNHGSDENHGNPGCKQLVPSKSGFWKTHPITSPNNLPNEESHDHNSFPKRGQKIGAMRTLSRSDEDDKFVLTLAEDFWRLLPVLENVGKFFLTLFHLFLTWPLSAVRQSEPQHSSTLNQMVRGPGLNVRRSLMGVLFPRWGPSKAHT